MGVQTKTERSRKGPRVPLTEMQKHRLKVLVHLDVKQSEIAVALDEDRRAVNGLIYGTFRSVDNLEPRICKFLNVSRSYMGWSAGEATPDEAPEWRDPPPPFKG